MKYSNLLQEVLFYLRVIKMGKKRWIIYGMMFVFGIFMISLLVAQDAGFCCERLNNNGAWCQLAADQSDCETGLNPITGDQYKSLPTSCEQSSFCTLGTCVNQREGTCLEGVPQQICNTENGGYWINKPKEEVPQCKLGCCIFGNNAFLGTATQCTYQSALSGIEAEFNPSITNEVECVANVLDDEEGACVYTNELGTRTCQRITKGECDTLPLDTEFSVGHLCSDQELNTICGPTKRTTCDGYDVYYEDSCGNKANIYDSNQYNNQSYWTYIYNNAPCDDGLGNKESRTCGQCEYYSGSICGVANSISPVYGDNICISLDCGSYDSNGNGKIDSDEKTYKHGEKWCATYSALSNIKIDNDTLSTSGNLINQNLPGSRYVQLECRNSEILETPCDGYRGTICAEDYYDLNGNNKQDSSDFRIAECIPNRWEDCVLQTTEQDCSNQDSRDCQWITGIGRLNEDGSYFAKTSSGEPASCVPKFAPGFDFWANTTDSVPSCALANTECVVTYEVSWIRNRERALADKEIEDRISKCSGNCYCIPGYKDGMAKNKYEKNKPAWHPKSYESWITSLNLVCSSLGDCGNKLNYIGEPGEERDDTIDSGNFIKKA